MKAEESWRVDFYQTESGREPVREELKALPKDEKVEIGQTIRLVQDEGPDIGRPFTEPVTTDTNAIRVRIRNVRWRIFFFTFTGRKLILVHMIKKKTEAIPTSDIKIAESRRKDWMRRKAVKWQPSKEGHSTNG